MRASGLPSLQGSVRKRLAAGITTLVCGQALINVAAVMGVAPLTGITLPFVSYGGSSLVVGLAGVGIILNIAGDHGREPGPRCLIAAGGTAGHVLPAIAVGEALRERGAVVTFAGSPDRVEARLVPEAGFALDCFEISALPRRPSVELVRSIVRAGGAVRESRRILKRRRPDVVLGAGSFVAGPMVVAASSMRIPTALPRRTRISARQPPRPRSPRGSSSTTSSTGAGRRSTAASDVRSAHRACRVAGATPRVGLPRREDPGVFGASAGARAQRLPGEAGAKAGRLLHIWATRSRRAGPRVRRADTPPTTVDDSARPARVDIALARAGRRRWRRPGCPRCSPVPTPGRPQARTRGLRWGGGAAL